MGYMNDIYPEEAVLWHPELGKLYFRYRSLDPDPDGLVSIEWKRGKNCADHMIFGLPSGYDIVLWNEKIKVSSRSTAGTLWRTLVQVSHGWNRENP